MDYLRFALVLFNSIAFLVLFVLSIINWRGERSPRIRQLWAIVAFTSGALVLGSLQRVVLQAAALGWLAETAADSAVLDWQVFQSVLVLALAIGAFLTIRGIARAMSSSERIASPLYDRVSHIDLSSLNLSKRETEVLEAIGAGSLTDAELADRLHISPSTVQTHVKSLLRKTGLNRRQDLVAVAVLVDEA